jgi:hypothetical protein
MKSIGKLGGQTKFKIETTELLLINYQTKMKSYYFFLLFSISLSAQIKELLKIDSEQPIPCNIRVERILEQLLRKMAVFIRCKKKKSIILFQL